MHSSIPETPVRPELPGGKKEIRRIGGARYLPAEGGVFIETVAELYGDGE